MHIKPKKSLGQNFLIDANIRRKIVESLALTAQDVILEIGAGKGEMTALIAKRVKKVYALEIDKNLCYELNQSLSGHSNIEILNQDILKFNIGALGKRIKVFGNIPYYISSPIIEHLLKFKTTISSIFITVQKEFARRAVSGGGSKEFGALSCFVQFYSKPAIIFPISRNSFFPVPKVDSALLRMDIIKPLLTTKQQEARFFRIVRAVFNQRRKTLRNSLEGVVAPGRLNQFFSTFKIDKDIRPEKLSFRDFLNLSKT